MGHCRRCDSSTCPEARLGTISRNTSTFLGSNVVISWDRFRRQSITSTNLNRGSSTATSPIIIFLSSLETPTRSRFSWQTWACPRREKSSIPSLGLLSFWRPSCMAKEFRRSLARKRPTPRRWISGNLARSLRSSSAADPGTQLSMLWTARSGAKTTAVGSRGATRESETTWIACCWTGCCKWIPRSVGMPEVPRVVAAAIWRQSGNVEDQSCSTMATSRPGRRRRRRRKQRRRFRGRDDTACGQQPPSGQRETLLHRPPWLGGRDGQLVGPSPIGPRSRHCVHSRIAKIPEVGRPPSSWFTGAGAGAAAKADGGACAGGPRRHQGSCKKLVSRVWCWRRFCVLGWPRLDFGPGLGDHDPPTARPDWRWRPSSAADLVHWEEQRRRCGRSVALWAWGAGATEKIQVSGSVMDKPIVWIG